jgi:hypothetical protein
MYKTAGGLCKNRRNNCIDTHALVSAMNILGDMNVDGTTFTTKMIQDVIVRR